MFLLDMGEFQLIGSSPETHVRLGIDGTCELRPIAGTRPRGPDPAADDALAAELMESEKDRAEHVMLVDLARNDLGRVCVPGSVRLERFMDVERYSHVMHIVSRVFGKIAPGRDAVDLLRATFPAGTVSGAPEGAGDADHLGARGPPPRRLCGRGRLPGLRRRHGHVHRPAHDGAARRGRLPAVGRRRSSPTPTPARSTRRR